MVRRERKAMAERGGRMGIYANLCGRAWHGNGKDVMFQLGGRSQSCGKNEQIYYTCTHSLYVLYQICE